MGQVSGKQASRLSDALRDAFLPDQLDQLLLYALEKRRWDLTLDNDYPTRMFWMIRHADAEGWVYDLVVAARDMRPQHAALQALAAEFGLSPGPSPQTLERIIMLAVPFADVGTWLARLGELEGQVCRVEIPAGMRATIGTGFLVAPDLCLTNYHVIQPLIDKHAQSADARLRFDYRRADDGTVVSEGTCFSLADRWLVALGPPVRRTLIPRAGCQPLTSWISRCCASQTCPATTRSGESTSCRMPRLADGSGQSDRRPSQAIHCPFCSTPTAHRSR